MHQKSINEEFEELDEPWHKGPMKFLISIFLLLLIVMMVIPHYAVKLDPEPKGMIRLNDISDFIIADTSRTVDSLVEAGKIIDENNPQIKFVADRIAASSCEENTICYAKALYYFVRDNIKYVSDPIEREYIESPEIILKSGAADCESGSLLLLNMMESIGVGAELVLIPGHAFLRIKLDKASGKYKHDSWIYLDWTCGNCGFGEVPYGNMKENMRFMDI